MQRGGYFSFPCVGCFFYVGGHLPAAGYSRMSPSVCTLLRTLYLLTSWAFIIPSVSHLSRLNCLQWLQIFSKKLNFPLKLQWTKNMRNCTKSDERIIKRSIFLDYKAKKKQRKIILDLSVPFPLNVDSQLIIIFIIYSTSLQLIMMALFLKKINNVFATDHGQGAYKRQHYEHKMRVKNRSTIV